MQLLSAGGPAVLLPDQTVRLWFVRLFIVGAIFRLIMAFTTNGVVHPDEHQMYLERAAGVVYGPHVVFWEEERKMRNLLLPGFFGAQIILMDAIGVTSPDTQLSIIRFIQSLLIFGSMTLFCLRLHQVQKDSLGAILLMLLNALYPEWVCLNIRTLSESACLPFLLLGLAFRDTRPFLSGFLFAWMFGIRFPTGFLIVAITGLSLWSLLRERNWSDFVRLHLGMALGLMIVGGIDYFTLGGWLMAPRQHFHANFTENMSALFGEDPWYQYATYAVGGMYGLLPLLLIPLAIGVWLEWKIGVLTLFFVGIHCVIAHKEPRFLIPILPLMMFLQVKFFMAMYLWLPKPIGGQRLLLVSLPLLFFGFVVQGLIYPWNVEPYNSYAKLYRVLRQVDDLTGLGCYGEDNATSGNYFHLRRPVPLIFSLNGIYKVPSEEVPPFLPFDDPQINYVITKPEWIVDFEARKPHLIAEAGELALYRLEDSVVQKD